MSYPSIHRHLECMQASAESASEAQLKKAFMSAFQSDLSRGFARVKELVQKLSTTGDRAMLTLDPNSDEGKEFARLLGPDIPRQILEEHFGVRFGFYNCCKGVVSHSRDGLQLSLKEQLEAQHPEFVDC